ncbi:MAG: MYXO-CTERM sorting domain-containing protein [Myxococcota bacterium]|nr:MYXO-CTERM sorting domain-containing protein [Myxococcota bacterium]
MRRQVNTKIFLLGGVLCLVAFVGPANAFPGYVPLMPTDLGCATCHVDPGGGGVRNAFGSQFASLSFFQRTWENLCALDADMDGFSNGQELGDPDCEWRLFQPPRQSISSPNDPEDRPDGPPIAPPRRAGQTGDQNEEQGNTASRAGLPGSRSGLFPRPDEDGAGGEPSEADRTDDTDNGFSESDEMDAAVVFPTAQTGGTIQEQGDDGDEIAPTDDTNGQLIPIGGETSMYDGDGPEPISGTGPITRLEPAEIFDEESGSAGQSGCSVTADKPTTSLLWAIGFLGLALRRRRPCRR